MTMMTLNQKLNYSPTHKSIKNHLYCSVKIMNNKFTGKKGIMYFILYLNSSLLLFFKLISWFII